MRHLVAHRKLGRTSAHRRALLRNLCTSFVLHERIVTTLPKAKELRPFAERAITLGRRARAARAADKPRMRSTRRVWQQGTSLPATWAPKANSTARLPSARPV